MPLSFEMPPVTSLRAGYRRSPVETRNDCEADSPARSKPYWVFAGAMN
jgi:hypothetical protein